MFSWLKKKLRGEYCTLNKIEISRHNLLHNYKYLSGINRHISVAPVLKSNAYGHGLILIAKILDKLNPPFFCVDSLYEAYELFKAGIRSKILIMGYTYPSNLKVKPLPFSWAAWDMDCIQSLIKYQNNANIHLFVDTGMNREGIKLDELDGFIKKLKTINGVNIEGLMSHFAMADQPFHPLTIKQLKNFQEARKILEINRVIPKWEHIAASSGLLNIGKFSNYKVGNMSRAGISLYGIDPSDNKNTELKGVLQLKTTLVQTKKVRQGESIGYDSTYISRKKMIIGILPIGYNDGVDRRLSNKGIVFVGGKECPIVGRISMNITTIDVTSVKNIRVGQEVVVFSNETEKNNSIINAAKVAETIPYELLIHLHPSIKRMINPADIELPAMTYFSPYPSTSLRMRLKERSVCGCRIL